MSYFPTDIPYMSNKEMKENGIKQKEVGEKVGTDELWGAINYIEIYLGVLKNRLIKYEDKDMSVDKAYQRGLEDGKKAFDLLDAERDSEYQRGLDAAWEAARKIVTWPDRSLVNSDTFDLDPGENIFTKYSASEAITKLKAYEEQKANDDIKVGDVVTIKYIKNSYKRSFVVTRVSDESVWGVDEDGNWNYWAINEVIKTDKHFEIDKILEAMKE